MTMYFLVIFVVYLRFSCATNVNLKSTTPALTQQRAVEDLIRRTLPRDYGKFVVSIDENLGPEYRSTFQLLNEGERVRIVGKDGVSAAWGFNYYLKHYCYCQIAWEGRQVDLPRPLPRLPVTGVTVTSKDQFRYYANVCTFSYSFVWWNWTQWETHIDWMAMNSINLPLAFTAQEAIWRKVYLDLGFTQADLDGHFAGPAFLAWSRMGNLKSWGGPLPESWYDQQLRLQKKILSRMREFAMMPVLPGFAGHVPEAVKRLYPNSTVNRLKPWSKFNETYSATLSLDARDPLFRRIGTMFIRAMRNEFGTDHIYNADPFNEMIPPTSDQTYLRDYGQGVFSAMTDVDNKAIWLLQGWMFYASKSYWKQPQVEAFLTSVPLGRMLVLDLYSDVSPVYRNFSSYYGQPFIWCMLLNFGGALGNYGQIENVNRGPTQARTMPNSSMVGLGLTMEGIFQNYVMYDFLLEKSHSDESDIEDWMVMYTRRRYGRSIRKLEQYWVRASETLLNCTKPLSDHGQFIMMKRPSLHAKPFVWYEPRSVLFMWRKLLQASVVASGPLFQYDLVDTTRQALSVAATNIYRNLYHAYRRKDLAKLNETSAILLQLFSDMDEILASNENFLLGRWIEKAKSMGANDHEKILYEFNARNQITLWGPSGEISDYAKKQWSGLMVDYYQPRWRLFTDYLIRAVESGQKFIFDVFKKDVLDNVERPFSFARKTYPTEPVGDSVSISSRLFGVYQRYISSHKIPDFGPRWARLRRRRYAEPRKHGPSRRKHKKHS